jgi:hypothetical protein
VQSEREATKKFELSNKKANDMLRSMSVKIVFRSLLLAAFCAPFFYGARSLNTNGEDLAALKSLNARFINNFITNDTVSHGKIIHKDFICITFKGLKINRQDYLDGWAKGHDPKITPYFDYRDEHISLYGNTALVRAVTKSITMVEGKESVRMSLYTDTYIKEKGTWKCIQAQLTLVSPENYPDDKTIVARYSNGVKVNTGDH